MGRLSVAGVEAAEDAANYYELLGVRRDASVEEIARAYEHQRALYNPAPDIGLDRDFLAQAAERRALLATALDTLRDPQRRELYDAELAPAEDPAVERHGMRRSITVAAAGVLAGLALLAALWVFVGRAPQAVVAVSEVRFPAPGFVLPTLDGGRFDLQAQRGKIVLVNFWATWCKPCEQETPDLQAAYAKLSREGLVIVGVDLTNGERAQGTTDRDIRNWVARFDVEYPIALDETGQVQRDYKLYPIPVSYFVDRDGAVRFVRVGPLTTADVERLFRQLQRAS